METCCLPQGPGHGGLTHLQARSPLALATVQSRPVALRPMLPTTVSRTYCLCWAGRGEGVSPPPAPLWPHLSGEAVPPGKFGPHN